MITVGRFFLILILLIESANAWDFRGYLKNYVQSFSNQNPELVNADYWADSISARGSILNDFNENFSFEGSYQIVPYYGRVFLVAYDVRNINLKSYRAIDLNLYLVEPDATKESSFSMVQNLDRLFFTYSNPSLKATLGRQIVTFGSAKIVNPTDVVTPFGLNTIDTEERAGSDSVRLKYFIGNFYLDGGALFGKDFKEDRNAAFARTGWTIGGHNFYLMFMEFRGKNHLYGFDWQGGIGGSTVWLETSYVEGTKDYQKDYARLSTGIQIYFGKQWSMIGEYHFNGIGTFNESDYLKTALEPSFVEANLFLVGRNYFSLMFSKELSALYNLSFGGTMNLNDQSVLINLLLTWNLAENNYLELGLLPGVGSQGSEFNLYPDILYLGYKFYF
jgi:hypothetical protein